MNVVNSEQQPIKGRLLLVIWCSFIHWLLKTRENWFLNSLIFLKKLYVFLYQALNSHDILLFLILCNDMFCSTNLYLKPWRTHLLLGSSWEHDSVKSYVGSRATVWNVTAWLLCLGLKTIKLIFQSWGPKGNMASWNCLLRDQVFQ